MKIVEEEEEKEIKENYDKIIISQLIQFESDLKQKLSKKNDELYPEIEEYFLINKSWLTKFISLKKKEDEFNDLIYFILKKISFNAQKYIYKSYEIKYEYYNNIKIIPLDKAPYLLSIINEEDIINNDKNIIIGTKIIFIESKIIIILENEISLEILNENYIPEYLLYFGENKNMTTEKMINIFIKEMKLKISQNDKKEMLYNIQTKEKFIIKFLNLKLLLEKEKLIKEEYKNKMNKIWENQYKLKIEKNLDEIAEKLNTDFQQKISSNKENFNQKINIQFEQQNKIFTDNYAKSVVKLSNLNNDEEKEEKEEKEDEDNENIIIKKNYGNIEKKIIDDYVILEKNNKKGLMMLKDKNKISSIFSPILFCLSQLNSLVEYIEESEKTINFYNYIGDTLSEIFLDVFKRIKNLDLNKNKEKFNKFSISLFKANSNLIFNFLLSKVNENCNIMTPGDAISFMLENLDKEQIKYINYADEEEDNIIDLNINNKYNIYDEKSMLKKFVDTHSIQHKTFIYEKFHNIMKISRLCKGCKKCSYDYKSFPTLKISLNKSIYSINPNQPEYEIYNALISKIVFPENLSQLLSPSYSSIKKELCQNCKKYNEIIYNNSIFAVKEYLVIDVNRENDIKHEMIFIYPEILDLRNQSQFIINLYELVGVIVKKMKENYENVEEISNENSKYICYFKMKKEKKWISFDENYQINEIKNNECIYNFKGVCILIYSKINNE
jgi:hypothetical protein